MRIALFVLTFAVLAAPVLADDRAVIYDNEGHRLGTVTTRPDGGSVLRDAEGNRVGAVDPPGPTGRSVLRDPQGNRLGATSTTPTGRAILRDDEGNRVGTLERSGVIRAPDGSRVGRASPR
ncbi:MAG: hypothetical protein ACM33T_03130 [Solirubrobacterales bacterium]